MNITSIGLSTGNIATQRTILLTDTEYQQAYGALYGNQRTATHNQEQHKIIAQFHEKWQGENSPFLLHFLIHILALMLCRKFELIPIKIGFFMNF